MMRDDEPRRDCKIPPPDEQLRLRETAFAIMHDDRVLEDLDRERSRPPVTAAELRARRAHGPYA